MNKDEPPCWWHRCGWLLWPDMGWAERRYRLLEGITMQLISIDIMSSLYLISMRKRAFRPQGLLWVLILEDNEEDDNEIDCLLEFLCLQLHSFTLSMKWAIGVGVFSWPHDILRIIHQNHPPNQLAPSSFVSDQFPRWKVNRKWVALLQQQQQFVLIKLPLNFANLAESSSSNHISTE